MKKTMIFDSEESYEKWSDECEEKEGGFDFLENRVCIINSYCIINGKKFSGRWVTSSKKAENFTGENYLNTVESIPFFKNLGGTERVSKAYTKYGLIPVGIISTSPDKNKRTIRKFSF